jgi:hypothetical protein
MLVWLTLAGAAELTCDLRGLQARIVYDQAGDVVVYDGTEVIAQAQAGPLDPTTRASCVGDRLRLVSGSNVSADGSHATLSLGTVEMNLGPVLDTFPPERFDPRQAGLRHARRAAASGAWVQLDLALTPHLPLTPDERDRLVEVLLRDGTQAAVARAWTLVAEGDSPYRRETGLTLLRMHIDAGTLEAIADLSAKLPAEPLACEWSGRIDWLDGKKAKARKTWATCASLSDEALAWCGSCGA